MPVSSIQKAPAQLMHNLDICARSVTDSVNSRAYIPWFINDIPMVWVACNGLQVGETGIFVRSDAIIRKHCRLPLWERLRVLARIL